MSAKADQSIELARQMKLLLAGEHHSVQGAALAQLLAQWVRGHHAANDGDTDSVREEVLRLHIASVRRMIEAL